MTTLGEKLQNDVKTAMKAGDRERLGTVRMLLAALRNEEIEHGELDQASFLRLVQKQIKQRREAAAQYRDGGREELAAKEDREAVVLEEYLPAAVGEDELRQAIVDFVAAEGLSGPRAMGQVMKAMLERYAGRTDGRVLQPLVRKALESLP